MLKTLFWIIVVVCMLLYFPSVVTGILGLGLMIFGIIFAVVWISDARAIKRREKERQREKTQLCEKDL